MIIRSLLAGLAAMFALAAPASAQQLQSHCIALVENEFSNIRYAAFGDGLSAEEVRFNYIGHSTYLIETPSGRGIATDYSGYVGVDVVPDVVTMNIAHPSHNSQDPDPRIEYVLRGWPDENGPAEHRVELDGEVLIRNVTTDIRSGMGGVRKDANSIFIIEVAGLCIGHLGHLHHEPSEEQYAAIGRLDVVMAPVDGGMTLDLATMTRVLKRFRASLVLPMHSFSTYTLESFLTGMSDEFEIERVSESSTVVSLRELPRRPTVRVLSQRYFEFDD